MLVTVQQLCLIFSQSLSRFSLQPLTLVQHLSAALRNAPLFRNPPSCMKLRRLMERAGHKFPVQTVSGGKLRFELSSIYHTKYVLSAEEVNFLL